MEIEWNPYESVGEFKFGSRRSENREIWSEHDTKLYCHARTDGKAPDDSYEDFGIVLIYNKYNRFSAVEVRKPSSVVYNGDDLLSRTWAELVSAFDAVDPDLVVSEKDLVSYKYGIAIFAPEKDENLNVLPTSITLIARDFFSTKIGIPSLERVKSFHIQAGFLEPMDRIGSLTKDFDNHLYQAWRNNRERGILLWNQIPIAFSYSGDLPAIAGTVIRMLKTIWIGRDGSEEFKVICGSFSALWKFRWNDEYILIDSEWEEVEGGYVTALNSTFDSVNQLTVGKHEFLAEWKVVLVQISETLSRCDQLTSEEKKWKEEAGILIRRIPGFGKFYQGSENVVSTITDGRKVVNFSKSRLMIRTGIVIGLILLIVAPVYWVAREQEDPYWLFRDQVFILFAVVALSLPLFYFALRWIRKNE